MARKDIVFNTDNNDVALRLSGVTKIAVNMSLLEHQTGLDNDHFCFAEVLWPSHRGLSYNSNDTILIQYRYHAVDKPMKVRFLLDNGNQFEKEYLINKRDNSVWFDIYHPDDSNIMCCELVKINKDSLFELVFAPNGIRVFSGYETDLQINNSLTQNKNLLLLTRMGSLYQYPLTGVGIVDYLNSNMRNAKLAEKLQSEFLKDGMVVVNAVIDSETGELNLTVDE